MKLFSTCLMIMIGLIIFSCGGNPEQEGDVAFQQQKYNQAISFYLQVKKSQAENSTINEKIALAYMYKGKQLFDRTHNIDAFAGNFEKGEDFIPDAELSANFEASYSRVLYELAKAYHESKANNEIQHEQYFRRTLDLLDMALTYDENNAPADSLLAQIKADNFEQTYNKGMDFFHKAHKGRNSDLYLTAQYYLERAVYFDPQNEDARKNLKKVRAKTMSILDMDSALPIAIAETKYFKDHYLLAITVLNTGSATIEFDPQKLTLVDAQDNVYQVDGPFTEKFDDGIYKAVPIEARKQLDGTVAFALKKKQKLVSLNYALDDEQVVKKYLP